MKNIKKIIPILIIFLTIGFAAVNYTLSLDGDTNLTGDLEDFKVYFSRVLINGVEDNSIVSSATELNFSNKLTNIDQEYIIDYDITNGSKYFDASISMTCTQGTEYLSVTNTFDTSNLTSLETRSGKLVLKRLKSLASTNSQFNTVTCTINAQPIERETLGEGAITKPANPFYIGREVFIGTEGFNIISEQENTITMLAQYNLGTNYRQSTTENYAYFSETEGWEYTPVPKEIDIQEWSTNPKTYVNEYVEFLKIQTGDNAIKGNLITLQDLEKLECTIPENYSYDENSANRTCANTPYEWLNNNQITWTRSAVSGNSERIWYLGLSKNLGIRHTQSLCGIRPTITISKKVVNILIKHPQYEIGKEISIGSEKFNVISDNGTTVSMLAKYHIGDSYKQNSSGKNTTFSDSEGWEYTPGPKEIDIQQWGGESKTRVNNYVAYLKDEYKIDVYGSLISLNELSALGCTVSQNYSYGDGNWSCTDSKNSNWLINNQYWWTSSASPDSPQKVWIVGGLGSLYYSDYNKTYCIRPVITISKEDLEQFK